MFSVSRFSKFCFCKNGWCSLVQYNAGNTQESRQSLSDHLVGLDLACVCVNVIKTVVSVKQRHQNQTLADPSIARRSVQFEGCAYTVT